MKKGFVMAEKDLRKLNRKQLLELLLEQTERAERLKAQLAETEKKLRDRTLAEMQAGSFAEASLKLNGVFEAAEAAANQYVENVKKAAEANAGSENFPKSAKEKIARVEKKCEERIAEIEEACRIRIAEVEARSKEVELTAEEKIKKLSKVLRLMYAEKQLLESIFEDINIE